MSAETIYLQAHYPHTSLRFLIPSAFLFAALTIAAWLTLWPLAIPFALVTLYLLRFTLRQARGPDLAIRVTDRVIYYRGWERGLFRGGLPRGEIPLHAIATAEKARLRSAASAGPIVALWLSDPAAWRPGCGLSRWARELAAAGDLTIACDETDRTADDVVQAIEAALDAASR
ncbi:MAG: hypothetical protein JF628_08220 [Sphingomonas sp.]|nr:hypothetical protein [Sphingomonas sp.]